MTTHPDMDTASFIAVDKAKIIVRRWNVEAAADAAKQFMKAFRWDKMTAVEEASWQYNVDVDDVLSFLKRS